MKRAAAYAAVFGASLLFLSSGVDSSGIGTNWVDPVGKVQAQDEALYAESVQTMTENGDWLTPYFMGRYALYKPPMLYWLSASAVRLFGASRTALRSPSLLAGALTVTLVFAWVWTSAPLLSALAAALLLASSHLFFILTRLALTDALLACLIVIAIYTLHRDPTLERPASPWILGAACGAALMTKAAAGLIPVGVACSYWLLIRLSPPKRSLISACAALAIVAAPWHLYQLAVHPRWFLHEYILQEHVAWGVDPPSQTSAEPHAWFYARRLYLLDPILLGAAALALIRVQPRLVLIWIGAVACAVLSFQYRNAAYLLPLVPALAIVIGSAIPRRLAPYAFGAVTLLAVAKVTAHEQPWGLPFAPETVNRSHAALDQYAALARGKELIIVNPDDQLYASLLPLSTVRYAYVGAPEPPRAGLLDFRYLGVTLTTSEFFNVSALLPVYERRLRDYNLASTKPVATAIWAQDIGQLARLIAAMPLTDFYLPQSWEHLNSAAHASRPAAPGRVFLLARSAGYGSR